MDMPRWLARVASLVDRLAPQGGPAHQTHKLDRRRAGRSLAAKLPAHLRRDIGADDG